MVRIIARYRIKEGSLDEVLTALRSFMATVTVEEPETEYYAFRIANSLEFLHVMSFPDPSAQERHHNASYTLEFIDALYPNCEEMPKYSFIEIVQ